MPPPDSSSGEALPADSDRISAAAITEFSGLRFLKIVLVSRT
jgi:hypothetical protein